MTRQPSKIVFGLILIHYVKENNRKLHFLDYEKAFAFVNSAGFILNLIDEDCGKYCTKTQLPMCWTTLYIPTFVGKLGEKKNCCHIMSHKTRSI